MMNTGNPTSIVGKFVHPRDRSTPGWRYTVALKYLRNEGTKAKRETGMRQTLLPRAIAPDGCAQTSYFISTRPFSRIDARVLSPAADNGPYSSRLFSAKCLPPMPSMCSNVKNAKKTKLLQFAAIAKFNIVHDENNYLLIVLNFLIETNGE